MLEPRKSTFNFMLLALLLCVYLTSFHSEEVYAKGRDTEEASVYKNASELFESGDTDKAIDTMKKLLQEQPDNAEAYERLGSMLLRKDELDEAFNAFNTSLKINPRLHTAKTGKGFALLRKGDIQEAESTLKDALILNSKPSMTYYGLGLLYEGLKDYEKAAIHFKEGIRRYKGDRQ
jgi:tetratricopeptide (TPR) repeat protein